MENLLGELCSIFLNSFEEGRNIKENFLYYNLKLDKVDRITEIIKQLRSLNKENDYLYDIIIIVAFHQSLPNCEKFQHFPLLTNKEILELFTTPRLLDLMRILMVNDTASHCLHPAMNESININKSLDSVFQAIFK
jgi:hypothetical protein